MPSKGGMNTCSTVTQYDTDKLRTHNVEQKSQIRKYTPCDSLYRRYKQAKPSCVVRNHKSESPLAGGMGTREGNSGVPVMFYFLIPVLVTKVCSAGDSSLKRICYLSLVYLFLCVHYMSIKS